MTKAVSTEPTNSNIAKILELLAEVPKKLENLSKSLSNEQFRQPLGQGERSFTEVLAHLIHCEARSSEAVYLALLLDEPLLADVHPERDWGKLLRFDLFSFPELLAYFKLRRSVLLRVLEALTLEKWSRAVREEGKKRQESVYWRARTIAMHETEHLSELANKLGGPGSNSLNSKTLKK